MIGLLADTCPQAANHLALLNSSFLTSGAEHASESGPLLFICKMGFLATRPKLFAALCIQSFFNLDTLYILGIPGLTHSAPTAFITDECSGYGMGQASLMNAVGTEWVTPGLPMTF